MGSIVVATGGSFPQRQKSFSAIEHGHAHAVADAIEWLATVVLPEAISQDHKLHTEGAAPAKGFVKPRKVNNAGTHS